MSNFLASPPVAFIAYMILVTLLFQVGKVLAGPEEPSSLKTSLYSSGEALRNISGAPGYQPFFVIALFFAILHLGILILGTGGFTWISGAYLIGLFLALIALILG